MTDKEPPKPGIFDLDPGFFIGDFANFANEVGYMTWAWNALHADLADVFTSVSGIKKAPIARAVWYALKADSAQRDILIAAATAALPKEDQRRQEIEWLVTEVGQISQFRNDAIHTLWTIDMPIVLRKAGEAPDYSAIIARERKAVPDSYRGSPRGARLQGKDAQKIFRALSNYCWELMQWARHIDVRLWDDPEPWPQRPQRPHALRADLHTESNPPRKRAKQQRPPKPSRT